MTITPLANHISLRQTLNDLVFSKGVGGIRKMFKQTRSSPRKPRRKCAAKTEARHKESVDDFRVRRDEEIPDERYLVGMMTAGSIPPLYLPPTSNANRMWAT